MNKDATPANGGSMEWLGVLSGSQPHRFGVWIEGGGRAGRWMSDFYAGREVWIGSIEDAAYEAGERQRVHGQHGFTYTVKEADA